MFNKLLMVGALVGAAGLAGCASTVSQIEAGTSFTVTQNELDAARSAYDAAALTPAANYRALGYCATGTVATLAKPCADRTLVAKFQKADAAVSNEMNTVQGMITAGNATGLTAAYNTLLGLISTAEAVSTSFGAN